MQRNKAWQLNLIGHADSIGSNADNLQLSMDRVISTKATLLKMSDIDASRIHILAKGEAAPLESNATAAGRQVNRRVDIDVSIDE